MCFVKVETSTQNSIRLLGWTLMAFAGFSCANVVSPEGGPRDFKPPRLLRVDPPDQSVGVRPRKLVFEFDEYLQLKDPQALRWTKMPLGEPKTRLSFRTFTILLNPDSLEDSTTYGLDLGGVLADLTEGNVLPSMGYAFSTGPYLDSLRLAGTIGDAESGLPVKGLMMGLYEHKTEGPAADTGGTATTPLPERWTWTDDSGRFVFRNLPARRYRGIAFKDPDRDRLYSSHQEKAFSEILTPSQAAEDLSVWYAQDGQALSKVRDFHWSPKGDLGIVFFAPPIGVQCWGVAEDGLAQINWRKEISGDTLWVYGPREELAGRKNPALRVRSPWGLDSLCRINGAEIKDLLGKAGPPAVQRWGAFEIGTLALLSWDRGMHLAKPWEACWKSNLGAEFPAFWLDGKDHSAPWALSGGREWWMRTDFTQNDREDQQWQFLLDSGAFVDGLGRPSLPMEGDWEPKNNGSTLVLYLDSLTEPYTPLLVQFRSSNGKVLVSKHYPTLESCRESWSLENVTPGMYRLSTVEDRNNNGTWDPGSLIDFVQPETTRWLERKLELKPGWTSEIRWR